MKTIQPELSAQITALIDTHSGADVVRALGEEFNRRFWLGSGQTLIDLACELDVHPEYPNGNAHNADLERTDADEAKRLYY